MAEDESEIKIPITAEADLTGFEETTQAAQDMQQAVEQAATQPMTAHQQAAEQVEKAAAAKQKERKAAEDAAAAEAKLHRQMELARKSRNELIKELERLNKLRREAAAAGDTEAFERLTAQSAECREAFEKLNQGLELTNIQFTQQAQMGMMAGQTLGSIGQMAAEGGGNVAGMAAQFLALGQAIKAGLGPVGWAMMALQGLQMAWDYFTQKQEAARKAAEEHKKAQEQLQKALANTAKAAADARISLAEQTRDDAEKARKKETDAILAELERRYDIERSASDDRLKLLQYETDAAIELAEARHAIGQISNAELEEITAQEKKRLRDAEQAAAQAEEARQRVVLREQIKGNKASESENQKHLDALAKQYGNSLIFHQWDKWDRKNYAEVVGRYDQLLAVIEARKTANDALEKQIEAEKSGADRDEVLRKLEEERARNLRDISYYEKEIEHQNFLAGFHFSGFLSEAKKQAEARDLVGVELLKYARTINQKAEAARDGLTATREETDALQHALNGVDRQQAVRERQIEAEQKRQEVQEQIAELERNAADREREWASVQQQALAAQKEWLEAQLGKLAEGSELWNDYSARLKSVNEAMAAERVAALTALQPARRYAAADTRTQEEIYNADRQLLEGKLNRLRAELSSGQNLTPELRKQLEKQVVDAERQLAGLAQAELRDKISERMAAVNGMATTQQHQVRDRRTQRQIMEADAAILTARRAELRKLLNTPGLDAATQQQINNALRATERQIAGLQEAWRDNRAASARWLRELQPPRLQAKNKMMQRSLDATAAAYARTARLAEQAAQRGDTKAVERYQRRMQQLAEAIDRRARDSQAGTRLQRQADDSLRALTRQQVATEQAASGTAKATQRRRRAEEQAARNAESNARRTSATAGREQVKVQQLNAELSSTRAAMNRMEAEHGKLKNEISALAAAVVNCANAAAKGAGVAAAGAAAAAAATGNLQRQVARLQKQIDRLNRKI